MSQEFNAQDFIAEDNSPREKRKLPLPKAGNQLAIVSLIVDLGIQERPDFIEKDGTRKEQKPCRQFAVFLDLPDSMVDYGGEIGTKPYRLRTVRYSKEGLKPWNFVQAYPTDMNGNLNFDGMPTFHPASPFRKLAKATGNEQILKTQENNMDISQLLGSVCMADVGLKEWKSKDGNKSGTDVQFNGVSPAPDGFVELKFPDGLPEGDYRLITFQNATADDVKYIHRDLRDYIKEANNYEGSQMQAAFVEAGEDSDETIEDKLHANEPTNVGPSYDPDDEDLPF